MTAQTTTHADITETTGALPPEASVAEHGGLLADAHTWVLFSTLIFVALVYVKGRKPILSSLDSRTAKIKADLDEAARLKAEAQALLADYQQRHKDAVITAQKIIDTAKEATALIQKDAEKKLEENLQRREALLLERIARAESAAVQELRHQAADIAAKAAEQLLADAAVKNGAKIVDEAIDELPSRLN